MDFKALMTKLETINNKQILTESEDRPAAKKKETTWTDKSGKQHSATRVQGSKSVAADKDADKERKKNDKAVDESMFKSSIAKALSEEFGYELDEADAPANPWANDPAKSAAWSALSPQDQAWLGGADPTDPYILARAPNKGKAVAKPAAPATQTMDPNQADRDDAEMGAAGRAMAAGGNSTSAATGVGNPGEEAAAQAAADGTAKPTAPAAVVDPAVAATREKFKALLDKLEKTGGVSGSAPAAAAPTASKKPATGAGTKPSQALPGTTGVPGAQISNTPAAESVTYEDDQILFAIKNVRF